MEFSDMNLTKDTRVFIYMLFTVFSIGEFYRKPYSTLDLKLCKKKICETRKLSLFMISLSG